MSAARTPKKPAGKRGGRWQHWVGVMTGTSLDGVDAILASFRGEPPEVEWRFVAHHAAPFDTTLHRRLVSLAEGEALPLRETARVHFALGELYATTALELVRNAKQEPQKLSGVALSGQTVFHQSARRSRGEGLSLQLGSGPVVAERLGVPVVSDLRAGDIAAGGEGAPLVPYADWLLFRSSEEGRVILNVGGIANLTAFPAAGSASEVVAFDTGPGNLVMDGLVRTLTGGQEAFDRDGERAQAGVAIREFVEEALQHPLFSSPPPRSTGREEFGDTFVRRWIAEGKRRQASDQDLVATACALTVESVALAIEKFVVPSFAVETLYVAGGGARNRALLRRLEERLEELDVERSEALGIAPECREALAFAALGRETLAGRPGNLPQVTGARHAVVLGSVSGGHRS